MDNQKLSPKQDKALPYNYSLYPIEKVTKEKLSQKGDTNPIEFCQAYNATLFVKRPFKKIIEF